MLHSAPKDQVEKEKLSSSHGTAGCGDAGMGQEKGLVPMRLEHVDLVNWVGFALLCLEGSFESLVMARIKHIAL